MNKKLRREGMFIHCPWSRSIRSGGRLSCAQFLRQRRFRSHHRCSSVVRSLKFQSLKEKYTLEVGGFLRHDGVLNVSMVFQLFQGSIVFPLYDEVLVDFTFWFFYFLPVHFHIDCIAFFIFTQSLKLWYSILLNFIIQSFFFHDGLLRK